MESYYIDTLSDMIVDLALTKDEQGFNLSVFYGLDADMRMVINACKRFPVMAQRQVVVVKEAQLIKEKDFELLQHYITHPLKSTILVVCYKSEKAQSWLRLPKLRLMSFISNRSRLATVMWQK